MEGDQLVAGESLMTFLDWLFVAAVIVGGVAIGSGLSLLLGSHKDDS